MKIYFIKNLVTKEINTTDNISDLKKLTNHYADTYEIFIIEGRKGSEINARIKEAEKGNFNDLWSKSYVPPIITRTRSEDHNKKISEKLSGRTLTQSHKDNISDAMIGNQNHRL